MSAEQVLEISELTKRYGDNIALKGFNYKFTAGVYGLLGPNGAGKSTLMNIITDNIKPTSGQVLLNGKPTTENAKTAKEFRAILGFMPQQQGLYPDFTLERFLYYMSALKGLSKKAAGEQIKKIVKSVNLKGCEKKRLGGFSGGMRQRAMIAQTLLGDPKIIILDEPTAGLDPKERIRIRNLISEIAFEKIVIIATHVVSDIEFIAKEVLFLKKGNLIDSGAPHLLCEKISGKVFEITASESDVREISAKYKVGNISKDEENVFVRVISENASENYSYKAIKPVLEDLYLYYFD